MIASILAHVGHDSGAHHYVFVLAALAVGFIAGRLSAQRAQEVRK
jgi:hypothetical protein